jgi:hypothetical protein
MAYPALWEPSLCSRNILALNKGIVAYMTIGKKESIFHFAGLLQAAVAVAAHFLPEFPYDFRHVFDILHTSTAISSSRELHQRADSQQAKEPHVARRVEGVLTMRKRV